LLFLLGGIESEFGDAGHVFAGFDQIREMVLEKSVFSGFDDKITLVFEQFFPGYQFQQPVVVVEPVGRIDQDQTEAGTGILVDKGENILMQDLGRIAQREAGEILSGRLDRQRRVVDEYALLDAPAQSFDAEGSAAGEKIKRHSPGEILAQDVEQGFFVAIGCGSGLVAVNFLKLGATPLSGYDSKHGYHRLDYSTCRPIKQQNPKKKVFRPF